MPREEKEPQLRRDSGSDELMMAREVFYGSGVAWQVAAIQRLRGGSEKSRWRRRKIPG
jgi:hypothetical protein